MAINRIESNDFTKFQSRFSKIENSFIVNSLENFDPEPSKPLDHQEIKETINLEDSTKNQLENIQDIAEVPDLHKIHEIHSIYKIKQFDLVNKDSKFLGVSDLKVNIFSKHNISSKISVTPPEEELNIDYCEFNSTPRIIKNEGNLLHKSETMISDIEINNEYPNINKDFTNRKINIKTLLNKNNHVIKNHNNSIVNISHIRKEGFDLKEFEDRPEESVILVKSVSYIYNKINIIPKAISRYKGLQELKLDHNQISEIPPSIKELVFLNIFTISFNLLEKIPDEISFLSNLKIFIVNNNFIKEIPRSICNLPLIALYFHENKITHLPTNLYNMTEVCEISFDWLFYIPPYCHKIIKEFDGSKTIEKLFNLCKFLENKGRICDFEIILTKFHENNMNNLVNKPIFANQRSLIHRCAINGNLDVLNILLKNNCNINQEDESGCTALLLSLKSNTFDIALRLLEIEGCDINKSSPKYGNPLLISLSKKKYEIAEKILIKKEVNPNVVDSDGNNPLHLVFANLTERNSQMEFICTLLIERCCSTNQKNYSKLTPLHYAIKKGQKGAILFALEYNQRKEIFNLNERCGKYDWTVLHYSVIYSEIKIFNEVLKSKVDLFAVDNIGKTARNLSLIGSIQNKIILRKEGIQREKIFHNRFRVLSKKFLTEKKINLKFNFVKKLDNEILKFQGNNPQEHSIFDINEGDNEVGNQHMKYSFNQVKNNLPFSSEKMKEKRKFSKINVVHVDLRHSVNFFNSCGNPLSASGNYYFNNSPNLNDASNNNNNNKITNSISSFNDNNATNKKKNSNIKNSLKYFINKAINAKNKKTISMINLNNSRNVINNNNLGKASKRSLSAFKKMVEIVKIQKNIFSNDYSKIISPSINNALKISLLYKIYKSFLPDSVEILKIIHKNSESLIISNIVSYLIEISYLRESNYFSQKLKKNLNFSQEANSIKSAQIINLK